MQVDVLEAKKRPWELIEAAQAGEEVVIVDRDGAAVRLVPVMKVGSLGRRAARVGGKTA